MANQGLQDLYDWLGGDNWKCRDGWLDPGSDVREWHGLTITTSGDLVSINLISNDLEVGLRTQVPRHFIFYFCVLQILVLLERQCRLSKRTNTPCKMKRFNFVFVWRQCCLAKRNKNTRDQNVTCC